jgi:hypothetical protein
MSGDEGHGSGSVTVLCRVASWTDWRRSTRRSLVVLPPLGAPTLPDEALHLAAGFQFASYPHVVGTLWGINDRVAQQMVVDLHRALAEGHDVATAPHRTVHRCRDRYTEVPALWAAHIHSGR